MWCVREHRVGVPNDLIRCHIRELFLMAVWPGDQEFVDLVGFSQAKMNALFRLREVGSFGTDLGSVHDVADFGLDESAECESVSTLLPPLNSEPMARLS